MYIMNRADGRHLFIKEKKKKNRKNDEIKISRQKY